ncbi:MAG: hypothetical protein IPM48_09230 [Saprospiraceae bacterium]|nr:hypothetical protein [Saprospiraceae bacterium]
MRMLLIILCSVVLLVNGTGALFGGYQLMKDPTGGLLQLPLSYLQHSPFANYMVPGIVLFIANGLFSMIVLLAILIKHRMAFLLTILQGMILLGWLGLQILFIQVFYPPMHLSFMAMGLILCFGGWYLYKEKPARKTPYSPTQ